MGIRLKIGIAQLRLSRSIIALIELLIYRVRSKFYCVVENRKVYFDPNNLFGLLKRRAYTICNFYRFFSLTLLQLSLSKVNPAMHSQNSESFQLLYIYFEGAKNIYVLEVLILGF